MGKIGVDLGSISSSLDLRLDKFESSITKALQGFYKLQTKTEESSSIMDKSVNTSVSNIAKSYELWERANAKTGKNIFDNSKKIDSFKSQIKLFDDEIKKSEKTLADVEKQCGKSSKEADKYKEHVLDLKLSHSQLIDEMKKAEKETGTFAGRLGLLGKEFDKIDEKYKTFDKVGSVFQGLGNKLTMGVTLPIVAAGTAGSKFAMDFETGMAKVSTIADETKVPIEDLRKGVINLSNDTGTSTKDLNEALYETISAGVDTSHSIKFVETAVKAAKGGFTDTATAVDGLSTVINSYGLEATQVDKIANQMLVTQNKGKTTFAELASAVGKVTPVAAALGIKTEELFSSLATTTAQGLGTAESVTALKAAMSNIIKPTKDASDAAEMLGIKFSASEVKSKGWMPFLQDMKEKLKQASPEFANLSVQMQHNAQRMNELEKSGKKSSEEYKKLSKENKNLAKDMELLSKASDSPLSAFATMFGSVEGLNSVLMMTSDNGMKLYNDTMKEMSTNTHALDDAYKKMNETTEEKFNKSLNNLKNSSMELSVKLLPTVEKGINLIAKLADWMGKLSPATQEWIIKIGIATAILGPFTSTIGSSIKNVGKLLEFGPKVVTFFTLFKGSEITVAAGGFTKLAKAIGLVTVVETEATATTIALNTAFLATPVGIVLAGIAVATTAIIAVTNHHKKQAEEVKKTQEAYKKFNDVLSGGSTKDLKEYEKTLAEHQKRLEELRTRMEEYKNTQQTVNYEGAKRDLEDYIAVVQKQGFTYDATTGKIVELSKVQSKINTEEQLEKITEGIQKRVDENSKITQLIDRYNQLNSVKKRTQAEDIELSNTAKELNSKYGDLKISIDKNGNAIITNVSLLGKKKTALEIDTQMIKNNAYETAKSAIYAEKVEIGRTQFTIAEIEKRMKARDAEAKAGMIGLERQTPQAEAEANAYLDAYVRLKNIKEQISAINIPQAPSGGSNYGTSTNNGASNYSSNPNNNSNGSKSSETYEVGIEATSKYSKILKDLEQNLGKVDNKIHDIQNKIETSKTIGTTEELSKVIKEQTNLYHAQDEKVKTLQNSEKTLNDNKKKVLAEFKSNFGALKNVDISKWEEDDFNNFIERTYKQTTIKDKARAEALKKGQKHSQDLVKDLSGLNSAIANVENNLTDTKKDQLKTLKDYWDSITEVDEKNLESIKENAANNLNKSSEALEKLIEKYIRFRDAQEKGTQAFEYWNSKIKETTKDLEANTKAITENDEKIKAELVNNVNALADNIKDALKKKYTEEEKDAMDSLNKQVDDWGDWKTNSEKAINDLFDYKARRLEEDEYATEEAFNSEADALDKWKETSIKNIEDVSNTKIAVLQKELDSLDEQKKQQDRSEQDQKELSNINKLKNAIAYEHNDYNKSELQKQLNQAVSDRDKRLQQQIIEDKKNDLKKQIDMIKAEADIQKDSIKDIYDIKKDDLSKRMHDSKEYYKKQKFLMEQDKKSQLDNINELYTYNKDTLDNELVDKKKFYTKKLTDANLNAEAEKMIIDNNQKDIVALLNSYGEQYKQAGQSLGEKLVTGFKPKIDDIKSMIADVTAEINAARESAISVMQMSTQLAGQSNVVGSENYTKGNKLATANSTIVNNNVTYNSPRALTLAEMFRKTETVLRKLAFGL